MNRKFLGIYLWQWLVGTILINSLVTVPIALDIYYERQATSYWECK